MEQANLARAEEVRYISLEQDNYNREADQ